MEVTKIVHYLYLWDLNYNEKSPCFQLVRGIFIFPKLICRKTIFLVHLLTRLRILQHLWLQVHIFQGHSQYSKLSKYPALPYMRTPFSKCSNLQKAYNQLGNYIQVIIHIHIDASPPWLLPTTPRPQPLLPRVILVRTV